MRLSLTRQILQTVRQQAKGRRCHQYLSTTTETPPKTAKSLSPLSKIIQDSIKISGPLPISRYIQFCLSHPTHGYYSQGDVFGSKGDFITSPEISQVFGELVAIWLLTRYMAAGNPPRCRIIELGPGRGTLMSDILRTFSTFLNIAKSLKTVYLIENSEKMRVLQKEKLRDQCYDLGIELKWNDKVDEIEPSNEFTMVIAHEFFDAMPFDLFEKTAEGWREVVVDLDRGSSDSLASIDAVATPNPEVDAISSSSPLSSPSDPISSPFPTSNPPSSSPSPSPSPSPSSPSASSQSPAPIATPHSLSSLSSSPTPSQTPSPVLRLAIHPSPTTLSQILPSTSPRFAHLPLGSRIEISQESYKIMRKLGHVLGKGKGGGAGLVVDYGADGVFGDSFRAFRNHEIVDVFDDPGLADLTANVDFAYLRESLEGTGTTPTTPIPQSQFLLSLGLQPRLEKLISSSTSLARREDLKKGGLRLVDPLGMGSEYKVMGLTSGRGMGIGGKGGEEEEVYPFPIVGMSPAAEKMVEDIEADVIESKEADVAESKDVNRLGSKHA